MSKSSKNKIGDQIWADGKLYVIIDVQPKLSKYKKKNQDTKIEGHTLGLRLAMPFDVPLNRF